MSSKKKTVFFCKECGNESAKWLGQCPACKEWNSFVEETITKGKTPKKSNTFENFPSTIKEIDVLEEDRISTSIVEMDRVLGGGVVVGSLVLVGGDPGIGKSTLLLQVCKNISDKGEKVLYISGEESLKQIKLRADRIGTFSDSLLLACETDLEEIEEMIHKVKPRLVVIDSIQTMHSENATSAPGSVSQVRETTSQLMRLAKGLNVSIFIVGHVTKDGAIAGPRVLEHMVDTVLYFEGEGKDIYRILRSVKNRFGSTNEIGVFEMTSSGLEEVLNPSEFMLNGKPENASGSVVTCSIEGTRPILIEIQALVTRTNFGMPRRTAAGTDYNRVNLLMAVLEKRLGLKLSDCDAYINIAGGVKMSEPALDLGLVMALLSSYKDHPLDDKTVVFGEVGLSGEIRGVNFLEKRIQEAEKMGFSKCIIPLAGSTTIKTPNKLEIKRVKNLKEILGLLT